MKMQKGLGWGKALVAGIAYAVISQAIRIIESFFTMDYYTDPANFALWSRMMMPGAGAPPMEFFIYNLLFGVLIGMVFAYAYNSIKSAIPAENSWMRGVKFGWLLFLVAGIPGFIMLFMILAVPVMLNFSWLVSGLVVYLLGGAAIGKIIG
ncbi:MAG: hypothetical protein ABIG96_06050 [Candidatus Micrarchaeota archaeon]